MKFSTNNFICPPVFLRKKYTDQDGNQLFTRMTWNNWKAGGGVSCSLANPPRQKPVFVVSTENIDGYR